MTKKRKINLALLLIVLAALGIGVLFITLKYRKVVYHSFYRPDHVGVKLFFAHPQSELLIDEGRWINHLPTMNNQALALVQELIKGPNGEGIKTIPPSTQLRGLTVKNGIAYVDFSPEIARNHPGGSTAELLTIYSIVDSLILNFPEIKKVQLLIDGHEIDTLAGHVNCRHPLIARKDLIAQEK